MNNNHKTISIRFNAPFFEQVAQLAQDHENELAGRPMTPTEYLRYIVFQHVRAAQAEYENQDTEA